MCGRFTLAFSSEDLKDYFSLAEVLDFDRRYNIAPSQEVPAIRLEEGERRLVMLRWGLIPFWANDQKIGYKMINARAETAHKTPAFRAAFRKRRCIIPAGGFFGHDEEEDRDIESCTIITTDANELVGMLHNRMPVILEPDAFDRWLNLEEESPGKLSPLLKPLAEEVLAMYPVSSYVNKPQNEGKKCIEEVKKET